MNRNITTYTILVIIVTTIVALTIEGCHAREIELEKFKLEHNVK